MDNCRIRVITQEIPTPNLPKIENNPVFWNGRKASFTKKPSVDEQLLYELLVRTLLNPPRASDKGII